MKQAIKSTAALLAGAACVPVVASGASLAASVEPRAWLSLSDQVRWSLASDALLFTTASAIVCAPVVGAVIASRYRDRRTDGRLLPAVIPLAAALSVFTIVSAMLTFAWRFGRGDEVLFVERSHLTLFAAAAALAGIGALSSAWFRHTLDAAGFSVLLVIVASVGMLVGGAGVGDLPRPVITAGLAASPLIAMATAAEIDIVRSDLLYQISPLAHMQIDYPTWSLASACYLAVACFCVLFLTADDRRMASALPS